MTSKEKLYKEYILIQNRINALMGKSLLDESEEYFASNAFSYHARQYKKAALEQLIRVAQSSYAQCLKENKVNEFYSSPEGRKIKERLESELLRCLDNIDAFRSNELKLMDAYIKEWLGNQWGVTYLNNSSMEIAIIKEVKDGWQSGHFGMDFTIWFNGYTRNDDRFEMNYGTMGGFDLTENNSLRKQCLQGMATFANDEIRLKVLKNMLTKFSTILNKLYEERDKVEKELKNPKMESDCA